MFFLEYLKSSREEKAPYLILVLDKTLKGIRGVRLDNRKVLCAPGPRTKYFESHFFCHSIKYNLHIIFGFYYILNNFL